MANQANTVGFTGCPSHQEVWRKQAARQVDTSRVAELFDELVTAFGDLDSSSRALGYFQGLRDAYALITGNDQGTVQRQITAELDRQIAEELAERPPAQVPS